MNSYLQILERREWKEFKTDTKAERALRKCGRNFLRFCDADGDRRITLDEWIQCMGLNGKIAIWLFQQNRRVSKIYVQGAGDFLGGLPFYPRPVDG